MIFINNIIVIINHKINNVLFDNTFYKIIIINEYLIAYFYINLYILFSSIFLRILIYLIFY